MKKLFWCLTLVLSAAFAAADPAWLDQSGSNAAALHAIGIKGQGIAIGQVALANARVSHEAFKDENGLSRLSWYNATNDANGLYYTHHDTWIAGCAVSSGSPLHPDYIGVAPAANLVSARVSSGSSLSEANIEKALNELIVNRHCRIIFTGFMLGNTPNGESSYSLMYDYYAYKYNVFFANPAGNYYNGNTRITAFGDCYNGLTVAGLRVLDPNNWRCVGTLSNLGPTADNRRKPDISAPSQYQWMPNAASDSSYTFWSSAGGETSFSTPHVAGAAALLLSYADTTADADDDKNEVIRAVLVNSTFPNINDNNSAPTTLAVYNIARGFGRLDTFAAYKILSAPRLAPGSYITAPAGWAYDSIASAPKRSSTPPLSYYVYASVGQRLLAALAFNRAITKTLPNSYTGQPLAELGLELSDPCGTIVFSEQDTKNNLRKFDHLAAIAGYYQIKISCPSAVSFGLAMRIIPAITGDFDNNFVVNALDLNTLTSSWLTAPPLPGPDLSGPYGIIDFNDFARFAPHFLEYNPAYTLP